MLRATISGNGACYGISWPDGNPKLFKYYVETSMADRFPKAKYPNLKIEYEGLEPVQVKLWEGKK